MRNIAIDALHINRLFALCISALAGLTFASSAGANELFAGVSSQDIVTPLAMDTGVEGVDFQLGVRGERIERLSFIGKPSPYILASVGVRLSERVDLEASWVHLSHGQIFSSVQNPGIDSIGLRLVVKLP